MTSKVKAVEADLTVKRYAIAYPASEYTFPHQAAIHDVRFDDSHIHLDLTDGRILSIPLWWIPTVYNACLLYPSPSPPDRTRPRMPSSA